MRVPVWLLLLLPVFIVGEVCSAQDGPEIGGVGFIRYSTSEDDEDAGVDEPDDYDIADLKLFIKGDLGDGFSYMACYSVRHQELWDGFVKYSPEDLPLDVTLGQFKVPFTLAGLAVGNPALVGEMEMIRSPRIYGAHPGSPAANPTIGARDIGLCMSGGCLDEKIAYSLGAYNGAGINVSDDNDQQDICGRLVFTPLKGDESPLAGLSFGMAYWAGHQPHDAVLGNQRDRYTGFVEYKYDPIRVVAEYIAQSREQLVGDDLETDNWYVQVSYKALEQLDVGIRYQQYDPDGDTEDDSEDIISVGVNWLVNDRVAVRFNYNINEEEGNDVDNNELILQLDIKF